MKMPFGFKKRTFFLVGVLVVPSLICFGQTNSAQRAMPPHQTGSLVWEKAAKGYYLASRTDVPVQTPEGQLQIPPAKSKNLGGPPPQLQPNGSRQMNAETESAQFQRIEDEGLLQTRQAMRETQHNLALVSEMGMLSHDPEALCLGEPMTQLRILGSGTASGVP